MPISTRLLHFRTQVIQVNPIDKDMLLLSHTAGLDSIYLCEFYP